MEEYRQSQSDLASSLQPPNSAGVKVEELSKLKSGEIPVDLAKELIELQERSKHIKEENEKLTAQSFVLEETCREHRRQLEDKEEEIIRLKEKYGRLKEKYERLNIKYTANRESFDTEERKWREEGKKCEEKILRMEIEKRKAEMDLLAVRRGADRGSELMEKTKAVEELKTLLEHKDARISELEEEKLRIEKELGDRVVKLEDGVGKWPVEEIEKVLRTMTSDKAMLCNVQSKGNEEMQNSASKPPGISLIQPKKEPIEDDVQVKGYGSKASLGSMVPEVRKQVPCTPQKTTPIVDISDDEDEIDKQEQVKEQKEVRQSSSIVFPSTTKRLVSPVFPKRKFEAVLFPVMESVETKRCKTDGLEGGKLWESASKMFIAFTTNVELCMNSVCALYRKQEGLGAWKDASVEKNSFWPDTRDIASLGKRLTDGDPEGKMKISVAEFESEDPVGIEKCRDIARRQHKKLFEIYNSNLDPLFK